LPRLTHCPLIFSNAYPKKYANTPISLTKVVDS
jgi:hypothetical protein